KCIVSKVRDVTTTINKRDLASIAIIASTLGRGHYTRSTANEGLGQHALIIYEANVVTGRTDGLVAIVGAIIAVTNDVLFGNPCAPNRFPNQVILCVVLVRSNFIAFWQWLANIVQIVTLLALQ